MNIRPILFSAPMVCALLEGRKTMTRRAIKFPKRQPADWQYLQPMHGTSPPPNPTAFGNPLQWRIVGEDYPDDDSDDVFCRYGQVGDLLYARETWQHSNHPLGPVDRNCDIFYRADYMNDPLGPDLELSRDGIRRQWIPSIHMPRWASRITLKITDVRAERLQSITQADCIAEGMAANTGPWLHHVVADYRRLWTEINGAGSWEVNPWVWVLSFEIIKDNVDAVLKAAA